MLDTHQIHSMLVQIIPNIQVCPSDKLDINNDLCCAIINTKPSNHIGEHWTALFKPYNDKTPTFFCSYGKKINNHTLKILREKGYKKYNYNHIQIQHPLSDFCGYYAIYFILMKYLHTYNMNIIIQPFSNILHDNDRIVINNIISLAREL